MSDIFGNPQVPPFYADDDTVYHYTSTNVVLEHILRTGQLRLSPRSLSNDPIENTKDLISCSGVSNNVPLQYWLQDEVAKILHNAKQVSFCTNSNFDEPEGMKNWHRWEKYGFAKPRMWNQYGDNYKGICLAFSRRELEKKLTDLISENQHEKIDYIDYSDLYISHRSIHVDQLKERGEEYVKEYIFYVKNRLFKKHRDFRDENEYRICSFSEGQYGYIDITASLRGIIISNLGSNPHKYDTIASLSNAFSNIDIQILHFGNNLRIETYTQHKLFQTTIEGYLKNMRQ